MALMGDTATTTGNECVFCAIAEGRGDASVVHEDETVVAFMDLHPVTRGHLLVVPRTHAVGLEDLDAATSARVWTAGHRMARALRRSKLGCNGINMLLCDGEAAYQSVFHFHLHVIPRYTDDGWTRLDHVGPARDRRLLDDDARVIRDALAPD